jgi:pyridoxamine 5'-phosphate oxidase
LDLKDLRSDYGLLSLSESDLPKSPWDLLSQWLMDAEKAEIVDFNAMVISTSDTSGQPSSRVVLLKSIESQKLLFFTDYSSQKGREIELNPKVAVNFFWPSLQRQIRMKAIATRVPVKLSQDYFLSRPIESRRSAFISHQSSRIDYNELIQAKQAAELLADIPYPDRWGGYWLEVLYFEFWQGGKSRLHDRLCYELKENNSFNIFRLSP